MKLKWNEKPSFMKLRSEKIPICNLVLNYQVYVYLYIEFWHSVTHPVLCRTCVHEYYVLLLPENA